MLLAEAAGRRNDDEIAQFHAAWVSALEKAQAAKMPALAEYYGLHLFPADKAFMYLAFRLAQQFEPGFKVRDSEKKRGRRPKWTLSEYAEIETGIARIQGLERCKPAEAVEEYLKQNNHGQNDIGIFRKRRSKMKASLDPRFVAVFEKAVCYERLKARWEISDPFDSPK